MEALACGAALVASSLPSTLEMIGHRECALLYEPGDVEGLCQQLVKALTNAHLRRSLVSEGLARIREKYMMGPVIREFEAFLYKAALQQQDAAGQISR
jgi:glycosyltransferase involved in cell wall biosynthesis